MVIINKIFSLLKKFISILSTKDNPLTQYIPLWQALEAQDGDQRIFLGKDGNYYHKYMVLEIVK